MEGQLTMDNPLAPGQLAAEPLLNKIVQDIHECIAELKRDFFESHIPIGDDNQTLHRFCAKLEYLLQTGMKEKVTLLGRRKDYWDYFCDCLMSNKGLNDGLKYVKSLGEYKTSLGKGRAFLRFALMHQRLADTLQQCTMNGRVTSDWYLPKKSIWMQHDRSSALTSSLYDINSIQFDLAVRGYDLDNAWPSFAKNTSGSNLYIPRTRSMSISSQNSVTAQESSQPVIPATPNNGINVDQLNHDFINTEASRLELLTRVDSMSLDRDNLMDSINALQAELRDVRNKYREMERRCEKSEIDSEVKVKEWNLKDQTTQSQMEALKQDYAAVCRKLRTTESENIDRDKIYKESIVAVNTEHQNSEKQKAELELNIKALLQELATSQGMSESQTAAIRNLEAKVASSEQKSQDMLVKYENSLVDKSNIASGQIDATSKIQNLLLQISDAESVNLKLNNTNEELNKTIIKQELHLEGMNVTQKNEIDKYSETIALLNAKSEEFRTETSQKICERKSENSQLLDELNVLKLDLKTSQDIANNKEVNIDKLKHFVNIKEAEISSLSTQLHSVRTELDKSLDLHSSKEGHMTESLQTAVSEKLELIKEAEQLKFDLKQKISTCTANDKYIEELNCNVSQLQEMIKTAEEVCKNKEVELEKLNSNSNQSLLQLQAKNSSIEMLTESVLLKDQKIEDGNNALNQLQKSIGWLYAIKEYPSEAKMGEVVWNQNEKVQGQISELHSHLVRSQETLDQSKSHMAAQDNNVKKLESTLADVTEAKDEALNRVGSLQSELSEAQTLCSRKNDQIQEVQTLMKSEQEIVSSLKQNLNLINTEGNEKSDEIDLLKKDISEKETEILQNLSNKEQLQSRLESSKIAVTDLECENIVLKDKIVQHQRSSDEKEGVISEYKQQASNMQLQIQTSLEKQTDLQNQCSMKESEIQETQTWFKSEKDKVYSLQKDLKLKVYETDEKSNEIILIKKNLSQKNEELSQQISNYQELKNNFDVANTSISKLENDNFVLIKKCEGIDKCCYEKDRIINENKEKISDLEGQLETNEADQSDVQIQCVTLHDKVAELQSLLTRNLQQKTEEFHQMLSSEQEIKTTLESSLRSKDENIQALKNKIINLNESAEKERHGSDTRVSTLNSETQELLQKIQVLTEEKGSLLNKSDIYKVKLDDMVKESESILKEKTAQLIELAQTKSAVTEIESELKAIRKQKLVLNETLTETKGLYESTLVTKINVENELVNRLQDNENLKLDLEFLNTAADKERNDWETVKSELTAKLEELNSSEFKYKEDIASLNLNNKSLQSENETITKDKNELQAFLDEKDRGIESLEQQLEQTTQDYCGQVDLLKEELSALEFQVSSERMQHEQSIKGYVSHEASLTEMMEKMSEQENFIVMLEQEMTEIKTARETESRQKGEQLNNVTKLLQARDVESHELKSKVKFTSTELEGETVLRKKLQEELSAIKSHYTATVTHSNDEMVILKSDNKQLKKKLVKLLQQKDTLWQKTDSLQFHQKVQAAEKWMEDEKVSQCMNCRIEFSFTVRKHHCRLCGRIFCYNCSNNWILTAHSSKKSRACNSCYQWHIQMAKESDTSLLGNDSDDEGLSVEIAPTATACTDRPLSSGSSAITSITGLDTSHASTDDRQGSLEPSTISSLDVSITDVSLSQSELSDESNNQSGISVSTDVEPDPSGKGSASSKIPVSSDFDEDKLGLVATSIMLGDQRERASTDPVEQLNSTAMSDDNEEIFHVVTDEEITRSLTISDRFPQYENSMYSSILITEEELEKGYVNTHNEITLRPGKSFSVPIKIRKVNTVLGWEFSSQPKDIVFSLTYRENESDPIEEAQALIPSCKCDSHKQIVEGELTAKRTGIYTLIFDNTYSRFTSKRVWYNLSGLTSSENAKL